MSLNSPDNSLDFLKYVDAFLQNEDTILAALYKEHYPATENYVLQNSGSIEDAKDIFQEAFVVLWRNIHLKKFVPQNRQSFGAYLMRVSKNMWISRLRSAEKKYHAQLKEETREYRADETTEDQQAYLNEVVRNMQKLGENCKQLLTAFYYQKDTMQKIAEHFGWTEATAKNNKYRCLEKLRNLMKDQNI